MLVIRLFGCLCALLLAPCFLTAQTISGTIAGSVKDPTDPVLVGAKLALIHEATATRRHTTTNEVGIFTFNSVQPGSYTLVVEQPGFRTFRRTNMVLTANERLPVEIRLELGVATETVRVEAQGATVQTASAERSGTVAANQLSTLMLKGRDFMGLLKLLPGTVDTNSRDSPTNNSLSGINIQGNRQGTYNLSLDGNTNLDTGSNTGPYFEPAMDSIAEVKVLMTNFKNFRLASEARLLQLRWELYNAWNHTQFASVDASARFTPDGKQANARFGALTSASPARQMQLSLRLTF